MITARLPAPNYSPPIYSRKAKLMLKRSWVG